MKNLLYPLLFGLFLLVNPSTVFATHIVGGEMNYRCLGNNMYEIKLTVFRDCYTGIPDFDDPASIGIFSYNPITDTYSLATSLGTSGQLLVPSINNDTLNPTLNNPCLVVPPDVCVNTTTYTVTANLPFQTGGYLLAYQRCCRNESILNIETPLDVGATYTAILSEETLLECNSNAVFNAWPPIYICVNEPIDFDHSATDIDGDSLVYRLCVPYTGASPDDPMPQPPNTPPFDEVTWVDPPYNLNNVMGGVPLSIDSETGFLTGTPNTIGQFVVGICVDEYRNGELISTTRRDFQYNVGLCGTLTSAFFVPEVSCEGLNVTFDNQSTSANNYTWYFNDPSNPNATSSQFEPTYTYSDTGTYTVMLVAEANAATCADTAYATFSIYEPSLTSLFNYGILNCNNNSIEINLINQSDDTVFDLVAWEWSVNNIPFSNSENPPNYIGNDSNFPITMSLTVTNEVGCQITYEQVIDPINAAFFVPEISCDGLEVTFDNQGSGPQNYMWFFNDPNNPGATSSEFEPTYTYSDTGTYTVMLVAGINSFTCTDTAYASFSLYEPSLTANFNSNLLSCEDLIEFELTNLSNDTVFNLVAWEWTINNFPFSTNENPPNVLGNASDFPMTISLTITNEVGCQITYEQELNYGVSADFFVPELNCDGLEITFDNQSYNGENYTWFFNDPNNPGATSSEFEPTYTYSEAGIYNVMLVTESNAAICADTAYATFLISPPSLFANFDADIDCQNQLEIQLSDMSIDTLFNIINWEWIINDTLYSMSANPPVFMGNILDGSYVISLNVTNEFGCIDTFEQIIDYGFQINYENNIILCERIDSMTLLVNTSNLDSVEFEWQPSSAIISGGNTNMPLVNLATDSVFYFSVTNDLGCLFEDSIIIQNGFNLVATATADPDTIYKNSTSQLEVTGVDLVSYEWSPTSLNNPTIFNPVASPDETTEYTVVVTDINGCLDTTTVTVVVLKLSCKEPFLFMPNAFSPNGDGENDVLYVEGNAIEEMYLAIYNRWGEKVFESKDPARGWDGTYKNQLLEPDVYGYYLTVKCVNGDNFFKKGNINLIR